MHLAIHYYLPGRLDDMSLKIQSVKDCEATLAADKERILQQIIGTATILVLQSCHSKALCKTTLK